jgi:hypothetical protein
MTSKLLVFALAAAASSSAAAQSTEAINAQLEQALQTIRELQNRVSALERERAAAPAPAPAPAETKAVPVIVPAVPSTARPLFVPAPTVRSDELDSPRVDNTPTDPALKGFYRIPNSDTMVRLGGYTKLDFIYDNKPIGSHDLFITSAIPTSGPDTLRGSQFTVQAKQTRLNVDLRRDTEVGPARLFLEGDWFGDASSNFEPGSYRAHLRHAWGQLNNFAAGYGFSGFMDSDALPDTLDFEGPGAAPFLIQASARYTVKLGANANVGFGLEAPSSEVTAPSGGGRSQLPDLTVRGRYEADWGHVQASGALRRLGWQDGGMDSHTTGYGAQVAGSVKTFGEDYAMGGWVWGKGIAHYIPDISGLGLDAALDPAGSLQALEEYGGYASYTHKWSPKIRSTGVAGYLAMNNRSFQPLTAFSSSQYYSLNVIWNPWGSLNVGAELLYGKNKTFDGNTANDTRVQMSVQYDFVR